MSFIHDYMYSLQTIFIHTQKMFPIINSMVNVHLLAILPRAVHQSENTETGVLCFTV